MSNYDKDLSHWALLDEYIAGPPAAPLKRSPVVRPNAASRLAAVLSRLALDQPALFSRAGSPARLPAHLLRVGHRVITLFSAEFVAPGSRLDIRFDTGSTARGDVETCRPHRDGFHLDIQLFDARLGSDDGAERIDPRFTVRIPCSLRTSGTSGHAVAATIVDVSRSGIRLQSPRPVARGTLVEVTCVAAHISGEVRYSREVSSDEFYIGVLADANTHVPGQSGDLDLTVLKDR